MRIRSLLGEIIAKDSDWSYRRFRMEELFEIICCWIGLGTIVYWAGKLTWLAFTHFFVVTVR